MHIGIDLGKTNTVLSYARRRMGGSIEPSVIKVMQLDEHNNAVQEELLPSVLFLDFNKNVVIGKKAKYMKYYHPERTISNSKRYMGTSMNFYIADRRFTPVDVAAHILNACKRTIELNFSGTPLEQVTITVPASFNTDQIRDTRNAALMAGFDESKLRIIPEPTAAFINFINEQFELEESERSVDLSTPKRVLVFDLGGGTCDIVVMEVQQSGKSLRIEEIAVGRYNELGGVDFDYAAARHLLRKFLSEQKIKAEDLDPAEREQMGNKLLAFCEKAKEYFSNQIRLGYENETTNPYFTMNIQEFWKGRSQDFIIHLNEYNESTDSLYREANMSIRTIEEYENCKNIVTPINETLRRYNIQKGSIDYVFLTGGMSLYYKVEQRLKELFPYSRVMMIHDPLEAVSKGAAIFSFYEVEIKNRREEVQIKKADKQIRAAIQNIKHTDVEIITKTVLAESILIDVEEGLPREIISKDQPVPCNGSIKNAFKVTSPSGIKIDIYAGEDCYDCKMRVQKSYIGNFRFPVNIGTLLDIEYEIDENKYLKLKVIIKDAHNTHIDLSVDSDVRTYDS